MVSVPLTSASKLDVGGWSDPSPPSPTSNDSTDANAFIERTREVKVDANDYSRFKNIGADLDEDEAKANGSAAAKKTQATDALRCRNCSKSGAKLKCSVCREAVYYTRKCQASDWQLHKRICKNPELAKKASPQKPRRGSTSSVAASTKATTAATTSSDSKTKTSSGSAVLVTEEPDLPKDVRGYKNGLPYFHRELSKEEKNLIGDIAPQKIETKPVVVGGIRRRRQGGSGLRY